MLVSSSTNMNLLIRRCGQRSGGPDLGHLDLSRLCDARGKFVCLVAVCFCTIHPLEEGIARLLVPQLRSPVSEQPLDLLKVDG